MSIPEDKSKPKTKILLIGDTGVGKSSLGNFILGSDVFKVGGGSASVTQEISGFYGEGDRSDLFVIDTPTLQDTRKENEKWLNKMIECIIEQEGIQSIIIVLDFNNDVLSHDLETLIEIMCNVFPLYNFWKHVCIVWTKCYCYTPQSVIESHKKMKEEFFNNQIKKKCIEEKTTRKEIINMPPMFYVDSQPEGEDNSRSKEEIERLITKARSLGEIDIDRNPEKIGSEYKATIIEEKHRREDLKESDNNIIPQVKYMRREIRIGYNGIINCGEWEVVSNNTNSSPLKSFLCWLIEWLKNYFIIE
ncbi:AIG1 family protein [Entamoeba histolytica HM-3:IMSS]|uniref:AIG1 family protein n=1 Tax=Entamoeba histolytica HM-3:IMSS TaxID=885315 RepID=M7WGA0_ENTHI|nr:AIG1 family protein [Entamoeba histolytica HM-3:IMSS]